MIVFSDISDDEDLGRRILVRARTIAPCIDNLDDDRVSDAIAILKAIVAEIPAAGSRRVRSKSRNGTSISYSDIGSAFSADDIVALRSLCGSVAPAGLPVGSFPNAQILRRIWPEELYT